MGPFFQVEKHMKKTKILGTGIYLPKKILHNRDLEKTVETNDEWIFERTGIRERRISSTEGGEWPTDMAYHATQDALKAAGLSANDIDLIIFASVTPDMKLPNSSTLLQTKLGISNRCLALILLSRSGFVYGLNMANSMIQTGMFKNALIVGSEMPAESKLERSVYLHSFWRWLRGRYSRRNS